MRHRRDACGVDAAPNAPNEMASVALGAIGTPTTHRVSTGRRLGNLTEHDGRTDRQRWPTLLQLDSAADSQGDGQGPVGAKFTAIAQRVTQNAN